MYNVMVKITLKKMVTQQMLRTSILLSTKIVSSPTTVNLYPLDICLMIVTTKLCIVAKAPPLPPAYVPDSHEYQNLSSQQVCMILY